MIKFNFALTEKAKFDKALREYLRLNRRANAGLVEHTAKKVVTGFSPRSPSKKKVKGLRQFFYDKRATATKIKQEAKARLRQGKGTLRPPKHSVSKRSRGLYAGVDSKKTWRYAINWRSKRGTAWLQATMLYKQWRASLQPKSKTLAPTLGKGHGATRGGKPPTRVMIRTQLPNPYVLWVSKVPGVTKVKFLKSAIRRALRDARLDMQEYIDRKHRQMRI